jgi:hypothetical protein
MHARNKLRREKCIKILEGNTLRKNLLSKAIRRGEILKRIFKEIVWSGVYWIHLAQDVCQYCVVCGVVNVGLHKCLKLLVWLRVY